MTKNIDTCASVVSVHHLRHRAGLVGLAQCQFANPWFFNEIRIAIRNRDRHRKIELKKNTTSSKTLYKKLTNKVNNMNIR